MLAGENGKQKWKWKWEREPFDCTLAGYTAQKQGDDLHLELELAYHTILYSRIYKTILDYLPGLCPTIPYYSV